MNDLQWKKEPPNEPGLWLRVNATGDVVQHCANYGPGPDRTLQVSWDTISGRFVVLRASEDGLKGWWWYGPIPVPPRPSQTPKLGSTSDPHGKHSRG